MPPAPPLPTTGPTMRPGEVAALFGVSRTTVTNWALAGRLAYTRTHAGHRRYPKHEVRALLARLSPAELPSTVLTLPEVASLFAVSISSARRWLQSGWLTARRAETRAPGGHLRLVELPEVQALLHMRSYPRGSRVRRRDHADERVLTVVSQQRRSPGPVQLLLQAGNAPVDPVAAYLVDLAQVRRSA